ncbi:heparinase II/III family protein [Temperatibacter marinus]|uniref:Heparinase II/III family protein n=1 Tax=Temperatibacter marinus TaxID=1456591 RepID=A0AA52HAZ7_9PROT|nr:heparinase II/III family protein [Temperatibacter marinus]WND04117.1 heparinase II/III family protein [Temperatibacter marinus]
MSLAESVRAQIMASSNEQSYRLLRPANRSLLAKFMKKIGRRFREWGYGQALYRWRLKGRHPVQILASPDDPAAGNGVIGRKLLGGEYHFENEMIDINESFWAAIYGKTDALITHAHRFNFLEDLAQVGDQPLAREAAEYLTRLWLEDYADFDIDVWQPDIITRRQISWCVHAPLILSSNCLVYKSKLLLTMACQARHIQRVTKDCSEGMGEVYGGTALILSGLILPVGEKWTQRGEDFLSKTLAYFINPDGGTQSRSTADAIKVMQQLVILKSAYKETETEQPVWLQSTLDKIGPFVKALMFEDGSMAAFGGTSPSGGSVAERQFGTQSILQASDAEGSPMESASRTGYQRLSNGRTNLIMDVGPAPQTSFSAKAGASCGAFELSDSLYRIITSMGPAGSRTAMPELAPLSRTSAAFSNHIVSDKNSTKFTETGQMGAGVTATHFTRKNHDNGALEISLTHDGYDKRVGVSVERRITLSQDGLTVKGQEKWRVSKPKKAEKQSASLRFHLHSSVTAEKLDDGRIRIQGPFGTWLFSSIGADCDLEESLYMDTPASIQPSVQIVIQASADTLINDYIRWRLSKEDINS